MTDSLRLRSLSLLFAAILVVAPISGMARDGLQNDKTEKTDKTEKKEESLPLKTASTIEFTTDEGTWMSLDVSADGKLIVFDLLGDIYSLPISGGEATRIIGGLSFESQPKVSPDGKQIAFLSDRSGAENV